MPPLKITKSNIDKIPEIPIPPKLPKPAKTKHLQIDYLDTELKGFGIRVSSTKKMYFVLGRVNGKQIRANIGAHGVYTPEQARKEAINALNLMNKGINPNTEKVKNRERSMTLSQAYEKYLEIKKSKKLKEVTISTDRCLMNCHLSDWLDKPIAEITKDMVAKRHRIICEKSGGYAGNNTFRVLRKIYNCVNSHLNDILPPNPVNRLHETGQWAATERRQTLIRDSDLPAWFDAVQAIKDPHMRNYLILILFTGLRKSEGLGLEWKNVHLSDKSFVIPETKNGNPHSMPMSDFLFQVFSELNSIRMNEYVFPSFVKEGKTKHMQEPKRNVQIIKDSTNIEFCIHDLRRNFKTVAQDTITKAESDRLTNHSSRDAGDGYIILSLDKVREPMQKLTNRIMLLTNAWSHFPEQESKKKTTKSK